MHATYGTEYDVLIAEDRVRERINKMKSIRLAQAIQTETTDRPSLLDRLIALTGRSVQIQAPRRKVGVQA